MAIITLITDWRNSDYYIGAVKGKILSADSNVQVIDINHNVAPHNAMQASFVLRNCYKEFPVGTIHLIGVNTALSPKRSLLIIEKNGHYFLCSDSGFPDLIFPEEEKNVYKYALDHSPESTFASLNVFVDAAFQILNNKKLEDISVLTDEYLVQKPLLPTIDTNVINGSVVYIDSYANIITNINKETFDRIGKGTNFEILVQSNHYVIDKVSKSYSDVPTGELVAIFNSADLLEIAMCYGPVAQLLDIKVNSTIRVKFSDKKDKNQLLLSGD
ncbi:MAG: SAM-dependent chlorinase/fluorinase [Bacteroidales bacterium]|nr:SAM-dependent chlorinase/fluorinase [Bacteroidales bacterium]MBN2819678.1 SAM-dependent chlorinase/fluorinase [Bacteroidales bacterium]